MNVGELIEKLKGYPLTMPVFRYGDIDYYSEPSPEVATVGGEGSYDPSPDDDMFGKDLEDIRLDEGTKILVL